MFEDAHAITDDDGAGDDRLVIIGRSIASRVLLVVFVERGTRDRIVSARRANATERRLYEEG